MLTGGEIYSINAAQASASPGDPACGAPVYQSLWFSYTSPVDQFVMARADPTTGSTNQRPRVSAWTGSPASLVAVDCNPDAHELGFYVSAGQTIYMQVYSPVTAGLAALNFRVIPNAYWNSYEPPAPKYNLFWYAQPLSDLPQSLVADVGAGRGDDAYDPGVCGDPARGYILGDTLWYRYTAPADGSVDVMFTLPFDAPYVGVFTGSLDQLKFVAFSYKGESREGAARFAAQAGVSYFVELGSSYEHLYALPATLTFRPTPAPTGGSAAAAPRVQLRRELVFIPEVGYELVTHLKAEVSLVCDRRLPAVIASITVQQADKTISGRRTVDCSSGVAKVTLDLYDAKGFAPGAATLLATGFDFDSNYKVSATVSGLIVRR